MTRNKKRQWHGHQWITFTLAMIALGSIVGCGELDSFLNPSVTGRWEYTPVKLPILDRLDVIDEPDPKPIGLSQVQPEDLVADVREYTIQAGDIVTISIFELVELSREWSQGRRVNELGDIRLPYVGEVHVQGKSPSDVEKEISQKLEEVGILRNATVTIIVSERYGQVYHVITEPRDSGTISAPFPMEKPYYTLLEALTRARGVDNQLERIYVIRQVPIESTGDADGQTPAGDVQPQLPSEEPTDLIEDLFKGIDSPEQPAAPQPQSEQPAPAALEQALDQSNQNTQWQYQDGKWVAVAKQPTAIRQSTAGGDGSPEIEQQVIAQRVIEIPIRKLLSGEMQYNIIIRAGDIIRIPGRTSGVCYVSGAVNNPGVFAVPGDQEMTLMNLIGGPARGINGVGIPEKVDLIRRIDRNQAAIIRLNLRAIHEGTQPDIFIKPNDQVNVGQTFWSYPLAIFRNGLRTSYGFGFVLDRNFADQVFY